MTQEDKELLLKDLCARLPYGVKVKNVKNNFDINTFNHNVEEIKFLIEEYNIKPYLRPMSSMTEEEKKEYCDLQDRFLCSTQYPVTDAYEIFDWLNKNKFDYRGLIPMELALEAPKGMYKTE